MANGRDRDLPHEPVFPIDSLPVLLASDQNSLPVVVLECGEARILATLGEEPEHHVIALEAALDTLAKRASDNPALHDLWQLARQQLEPLRAAITRARVHGVECSARDFNEGR